MFPFILLGKIIATFKPLGGSYDIFFFFPGYAIGGAERVNAEIVKCFEDKKVIIFFTKHSPNDGMKHFFTHPNVTLKEIGRWADNKWIYWGNLIFRGICSQYINTQNKCPVVFIGQCNFGYKLTPHLSRRIKIHELIHMYDPKFTWVWAPFIKFIETRIVVGEIFKIKFEKCYKSAGIPLEYLNRLKIVFYRLEYLPSIQTIHSFDLPIKFYYAGRGGPQKRIWIIIQFIRKCRMENLPVEFKLAGPIRDELPEDLISDGTYLGEIKGGEGMYNLHMSNDILLMTSAWEGFPLVIMEAMAFGAIPLVPYIDAIPEHIEDGLNGLLIREVNDEYKMLSEMMRITKEICNNHYNLQSISSKAFSYAINNFSADKFRNEYRKILLK